MNRLFLLREIVLALKVFPICVLLGPQQAGKTTLARMYAEKHYPNNSIIFDLENPAQLARLENPMLTFSQVTQSLIIIDEIQLRPDLFPILRVIVDDPTNKHKFLILGSASRDLIRQSSESLTGRIGYIEVMPFSIEETHEVINLWIRGGFPRSYLADDITESNNWRQNYIKTFLEQYIRNLGFKISPQRLYRFLVLLAHYHGQILNASELGRAMGISNHTVKKYIDILAGTFMVRILEPWFENIQKRQVKSPKIYFRDSGILHTLLNLTTPDLLYNNPKVGASWEGFALEEVVRYSHTNNNECFFWSTQSNAELDLFIVQQGKRVGFEFKYTDNPKTTRSMHIALEDLHLDHIYIIVPGNHFYVLDNAITVCGIDVLINIFKQ